MEGEISVPRFFYFIVVDLLDFPYWFPFSEYIQEDN